MNAESKMWLDQLQAITPQWKLSLGQHFQPGAGLLATDAYVYVIDTSTNWMAGAALATSEMRRMRATLDANPSMREAALNGCTAAVLAAGDRGLNPGTADGEACLVSAIAALALTRSWDLVLNKQNSLAGHWFYVVYRLRGGPGGIGRPGFVSWSEPGFLPQERIDQLVAQMLHADADRNSNVGRMLAADGGAQLSERFERMRGG